MCLLSPSRDQPPAVSGGTMKMVDVCDEAHNVT
jgi:hypothetical protein